MKKILLAFSMFLAVGTISFAQQQTINFDNVPLGALGIVDGFDFTGWNTSDNPNCGYAATRTSPPHVAFSPFEATPLEFSRIGDPFKVISMQVGAGWNCNMVLRMEGFLNGNMVYQEEITVNANGGLDWQPNWDVDRVVVTRTVAGTNCCAGGAGGHYVIDDLVVGAIGGDVLKPLNNGTSVPTMTQWGLFLFGLIVLTLGVVYVYNLSVSSAKVQE